MRIGKTGLLTSRRSPIDSYSLVFGMHIVAEKRTSSLAAPFVDSGEYTGLMVGPCSEHLYLLLERPIKGVAACEPGCHGPAGL